MNPLMQNLENEREKVRAAKAKQKNEGGVVTRFGNYYSEEEWELLQAEFDRQYREAADWLEKERVIKRQAMEMVKGSGLFTADQLPTIRAILGDLSRARFTSDEKRAVVEAASEWFNEQMKGVR